MFEEWMAETNRYVQKHIDRRLFQPIAAELDADIAELSSLYAAILLENGVIDENGEDTDVDFDEDDLLEAMLSRFIRAHPADEEQELLYASLIDAYLTLVEEASEDG